MASDVWKMLVGSQSYWWVDKQALLEVGGGAIWLRLGKRIFRIRKVSGLENLSRGESIVAEGVGVHGFGSSWYGPPTQSGES